MNIFFCSQDLENFGGELEFCGEKNACADAELWRIASHIQLLTMAKQKKEKNGNGLLAGAVVGAGLVTGWDLLRQVWVLRRLVRVKVLSQNCITRCVCESVLLV